MNGYKEKFSDNIWFTRKARIHATERLKKSHEHSQLLLIEYTLLGSILAIIILRHSNLLGEDTDILMTIMSVVILVLSLVITNFDMKERSNMFFKNYIKLQTIYLETLEIEKVNGNLASVKEQYQLALLEVENHLRIDDICIRVDNAKTLYSRKPTFLEYVKCYIYKFCCFTFLTMLYFAPIAIGYFYYMTSL
ncbi:SLATT domain-containing protein [Sulfurovum sp.]|uniref:SLATT domain-containing protein n=1 Tax=Sulfurovum sp. TaxID=1969726 RepID=UPI00356414E5